MPCISTVRINYSVVCDNVSEERPGYVMVCDVCYFILAFRPRDDRRQNNGFVFYTTRILRNSAMPASVCLSVSVCLSRDVSMGGLTAGVFFGNSYARDARATAEQEHNAEHAGRAAAGRPRSRSCCDHARACRHKQVIGCPAATCRTRTLSRACAEPFCPLRLLTEPATTHRTLRLPACFSSPS